MCLRAFHKSEKRNKRVNPETLYVMYHDKHIYVMDANIDSLKLKIETYRDKINQICKKPSPKYSLIKKEENTTTHLMKNIEDIENIFYNTEIKDTVYILYANSIKDLFIHFYNKGIQA
jgi:hypothetical protein